METREAEARAFVVADTSGQQQAQQLDEVTACLKRNARIPQARREPAAARDRWLAAADRPPA